MPALNPKKLRLARLFDRSGCNRLLLAAQRRWLSPHVRVVNYHHIAVQHAEDFAAQLRFFRRVFEPADEAALRGLLEGHWPHEKPGLVISFDDGIRSHFEVAAPLLERYGFVGWFFVPAAFPDVAPERQREYLLEHRITPAAAEVPGRVAMTWDEIRRLDRRHVVGCHTMNHRRLGPEVGRDELEAEVAEAKRRMEDRLDRDVPIFCWVGGEESSYSSAAARAIRRAGFELGFMTNNALVRPGTDPLQIQRTNLEAHFPPHLIRFQLCGFLDLMYLPKRLRVNRLTAPDPEEIGTSTR